MNDDATSLDRLHDILMPGPVPWWPPAPGWSWLLALGTLLIAALALRALARWQHNRYRREAIAELARQEPLLTDPARRIAALAGIAELLKRAALTAFPRADVAALTGKEWFTFLDRTGGSAAFSDGAGAILENAAYDPRANGEIDEARARNVASLVHRWLTEHRTGNFESEGRS